MPGHRFEGSGHTWTLLLRRIGRWICPARPPESDRLRPHRRAGSRARVTGKWRLYAHRFFLISRPEVHAPSRTEFAQNVLLGDSLPSRDGIRGFRVLHPLLVSVGFVV